MDARLNRKSLLYGVPGMTLQIAGLVMKGGVGALVQLTGTVLLLIGLALYAKAKGRHPAWCLMAFLSLIGLLVLASLKDKSPNETRPAKV
jgi:hypothetical protein